jgi:hypothetical protein
MRSWFVDANRHRLSQHLAATVLGIPLLVACGIVPASAGGSDFQLIAQETSDTDAPEVSPAQVEKYVAVYKAMQRDRSLTVDAAAAQNGMTIDAFRALESRVQRDDAALTQARQQLQASANRPQATATPGK